MGRDAGGGGGPASQEWAYVLAHCLLHLGMDHFRRERMDDPAWQAGL